MVRVSFTGNHLVNDHIFSIPLGVGLFVMASVLVALCANHGRRRASRKEENKYATHNSSTNSNSNSNSSSNDNNTIFGSVEKDDYYQEKLPPRSPLRSPRQLITTISNKAMSSLVVGHKRGGGGGDGGKVVEEGFGQGGLWQKEILMGVKCQPPEFSGVIYYDCDGHQVSEFPPRSPRSPRIAPSPDFTFPVANR